jgi:hypothetical protein
MGELKPLKDRRRDRSHTRASPLGRVPLPRKHAAGHTLDYKNGDLVRHQCGQRGLDIRMSVELAANSNRNEINRQILRCASCGFEPADIYREEQRDG